MGIILTIRKVTEIVKVISTCIHETTNIEMDICTDDQNLPDEQINKNLS